jgi:lysozyme
MKINQAGLQLIKSFEGCRLEAYNDPLKPGLWTIGFGMTGPGIHQGITITQEEAEEMLLQRLAAFEKGVEAALKVPVTENQFSALVCFAYNVGLGSLKQSLLLNCVNHHNFADAAKQFLRWDHAGGKVVAGLLRRREAEKALFES